MNSKILIFGGSGYIGEKICEEAVKNQYEVTGLSRKGISENLKEFSKNKIKWITGNALNKEIYIKELPQYKGILHCIGILFEKKPLSLFSKNEEMSEITYEKINRDTALAPLQTLAELKKNAENEKAIPFCFLSAGQKLPLFARYMKSKEEVEQKMLELEQKGVIRPIILKPGFVYDSNTSKYYIAKFVEQVHWMDSFLENKFGFGFNIAKPVSLDCLAKAAIYSLGSNDVKGAFDTYGIEKLGRCNDKN